MMLTILFVAALLASQGTADNVGKNDCCPGENVLSEHPPHCEKKFADAPNVTIKLACEMGSYMVDAGLDPTDNYTIDDDGTLTFMNMNGEDIDKEDYCLVRRRGENGTLHEIALVCFRQENNHYVVYGSLCVISVLFLILTLIVYALVPQLRDLQGMCIMCLCAALALGFGNLSSVQLGIGNKGVMCLITGFGIYFWMLAAFFWMNVIAINVMRTTMFKNSDLSDLKIFGFYNIYAWGMPAIFLMSAAIAHNMEGDHLKPGFGSNGCWLAGQVETWTYFYIPIAIILAVNIILYAMTSLRLWQRIDYENPARIGSLRYKFLLYFKLFIVTGISWIFEIISFACGNKGDVWFITDIFNAIQGLVFFLLLVVFRKRALVGLSKVITIPYLSNLSEKDEECDDIIREEEEAAMNNPRSLNF